MAQRNVIKRTARSEVFAQYKQNIAPIFISENLNMSLKYVNDVIGSFLIAEREILKAANERIQLSNASSVEMYSAFDKEKICDFVLITNDENVKAAEWNMLHRTGSDLKQSNF